MIKRVLQGIMSIPGVKSAAIVGRDGLVIEAASQEGVDNDALGALASTGIGTMETIGWDFSQGDLDIIISEFSAGTIVMCALSRKELLAIVARPECQIGKIRYEIKRYRQLITDLL